MTLHSAVAALAARWLAVQQARSRLELTMAAPTRDEIDRAVVEDLRGVVDELGGILREGAAALTTIDGEGERLEPRRLRDAVTAANAAHLRLSRTVHDRLLEYAVVAALRRAGSQHGDEGRKWAATVHEQASRCADAIEQVGPALLECWRELAAPPPASPATAAVHATVVQAGRTYEWNHKTRGGGQ